MLKVAITDIHADEQFNCRGEIAPIDVVDLAKDIERRGLIQPIIVTKYSEEQRNAYNKKYRLIAGFRRVMAHIVLKKDTIEAIITDAVKTEQDAYFFNLAENIQRKDLSIMQESTALKKLKDLGITEEMAAEKLGKSRGWVQIRYLLLKLPKPVQQEVEAGIITQTQIRELYSIYHLSGEEACFSAVKKLKDARITGRKAQITHHADKKVSKRQRKRPEIFLFIDYICDEFGDNYPKIATRCLAWAAGEISNLDILESLAEYAISIGKEDFKPKEWYKDD